MSPLFWTLLIFLHVMAATFWVGGQLMLVVVVLPLLRRRTSPQLVRELATATGRRFAAITNWVLLPILVVTGLTLAWGDGVRPDNLTSTPFGRVLLVKAALVVVVFSLAGLHGIAARRPGHGGRHPVDLGRDCGVGSSPGGPAGAMSPSGGYRPWSAEGPGIRPATLRHAK